MNKLVLQTRRSLLRCVEPGCDEPRLIYPSKMYTKCRKHRNIENSLATRQAEKKHPERKQAQRRKNNAKGVQEHGSRLKLYPETYLRARLGRQAAQAGILLRVQVEADYCGVCLQALTAEIWPHPLSTTVGHEPPLSVAKRDGWKVVTERPEHWMCNEWKRARTDAECTGRAWQAYLHACTYAMQMYSVDA